MARTDSDARVSRARDAVSDPDSTDASGSLIDPDATIVLGAREEGWIGRDPPQIADGANLTLDLRAGETYDRAFRFPDAMMTPTATPRRATETTLRGPAPRTPSPGSEPETTLEPPTETPPSYEVAAHLRLCGRVRGWLGRGPERTDGTENQTLNLRPGERYSVTWANSDGLPHNVAILDREGDVVLQTEIMSTEGKRQWTMFIAAEEMDEYRCAVHPSSTRGRIETTAGGTPTS